MVAVEFSHQVREALAHLHNGSRLGTLPLATVLGDGGQPLTGDALSRLILEAIEQLKPARSTPGTLADWRRYRHLFLRYVEGYGRDQVARDLTVSSRQASRDHEQAIDALAALLWARRASRQPGWESIVDPSPADSNLIEVLRGVLVTLRAVLANRLVRVEQSVPDTLPMVAVDGGLLRQALLHLLSFAAEAAQGGTVYLTAADVAEGVVVRIRAARPPGHGPAEDTEKSRDLLSVGCRLLGDRRIAVTVEEEIGAARTLTIVLPPSDQPRVLVVDDNPDLVELFRRYLRGQPYRLVQATSGASALRVASELRPDVIILDVMLPSQDGWDVLHDLRATDELRETPVIVCSVLPERALAEELGVTDFLLKPVTRPSLLAALDRWCPARAARPARP